MIKKWKKRNKKKQAKYKSKPLSFIEPHSVPGPCEPSSFIIKLFFVPLYSPRYTAAIDVAEAIGDWYGAARRGSCDCGAGTEKGGDLIRWDDGIIILVSQAATALVGVGLVPIAYLLVGLIVNVRNIDDIVIVAVLMRVIVTGSPPSGIHTGIPQFSSQMMPRMV